MVSLYGPPWGIRTLDHRNRNPVLYPAELRAVDGKRDTAYLFILSQIGDFVKSYFVLTSRRIRASPPSAFRFLRLSKAFPNRFRFRCISPLRSRRTRETPTVRSPSLRCRALPLRATCSLRTSRCRSSLRCPGSRPCEVRYSRRTSRTRSRQARSFRIRFR